MRLRQPNARSGLLIVRYRSLAAKGGGSLMALPSAGNERVRRVERGKHVATGKDEALDAGGPQRLLAFARPPGEIDTGAGRRESLGGAFGLSGIDVVRRAQAGEAGARALECRRHLVVAGEAVIGYRLDAASLEEIPGEGRAGGEVGGLAEI